MFVATDLLHTFTVDAANKIRSSVNTTRACLEFRGPIVGDAGGLMGNLGTF